MVNTLDPPASVILSWPRPNYDDPYDSGPALFITIIVFSITIFCLVLARIYSRVFLTRAPGSDDALIAAGTLLTIVLNVFVAIGNKTYYTGRHVWDIPVNSYSGHRMNIWICEWLYLAAAACIKISVLLFYRRLSVSFSRGFVIATWIGIVYNILVWLGFVICLVSLCHPIEAYWKEYNFLWEASHTGKFHCATEQVTLPLSGALSVIGDFYATLLPLFMISTTRRSLRQKLGLYILFGVGFVSVAAGIVRTYLLYDLIDVDYDFSIPLYYMWLNTTIELSLAIIAASAPALKPFFRRFVVVPVSIKAKSSGNRSTTVKTPEPWTPTGGWSHSSSHEGRASVDIERIGIAREFPEQIKPHVHTTWVELKKDDPHAESIEMHNRRESRMISFPEERTPSFEEIGFAR